MSEVTPEEFWNILHDSPEPKPIFYRLYYNDDGTPICYTMEDLPGKYIDISLETYRVSLPNVRVVNEQLVVIKPATTIKKLHPSDRGTPCDPRDVCIVVDESQEHIKWNIKNYEIN